MAGVVSPIIEPPSTLAQDSVSLPQHVRGAPLATGGSRLRSGYPRQRTLLHPSPQKEPRLEAGRLPTK